MRWFQELPLRRKLWLLLSGLFLFRLVLAYVAPLTGEEAALLQHVQAGQGNGAILDGWLYLASGFFFHPLLFRLPQILLPLFVAGLMPRIFISEDEDTGYLAAMAWLSFPPQLLHVEMTTLTPLSYFVFGSIAFFCPGVRDENHQQHLGAGAFLGLALLADTQAWLLLAAYLLFALLSPARERRSIDVLIVFATAALVALLTLAAGIKPSWQLGVDGAGAFDTLFLWAYAAFLLVGVVLVGGIYVLMRRSHFLDIPVVRALWIVALLPLGVLALSIPFGGTLSAMLAYAPALVIAIVLVLGREASLQATRWMFALSLFAAAIGLLWFPVNKVIA